MSHILIGPLPVAYDSIGGAKVAFAEFVAFYEAYAPYDFRVLNTSRSVAGVTGVTRLYRNVRHSLALFFLALRTIKKNDVVVLNISRSGIFTLAPPIILLTRLKSASIAIRYFGGNPHSYIRHKNSLVRWLYVKIIGSVDLILCETHNILQFLSNYCDVAWFPNGRDFKMKSESRLKIQRILCLSQLKKAKGIPELIAAAPLLDDGLKLDIVGPNIDCEDIISTAALNNVHISGAVEPQDIPELYDQYDLVVLPTKRSDDGYPGVIIEALQKGIPVVCSDLPNLAELITDCENGIRVPAGSFVALAEAINKLARDEQLYMQCCRGAILTGQRFRSRIIFQNVVTKLARLSTEECNH